LPQIYTHFLSIFLDILWATKLNRLSKHTTRYASALFDHEPAPTKYSKRKCLWSRRHQHGRSLGRYILPEGRGQSSSNPRPFSPHKPHHTPHTMMSCTEFTEMIASRLPQSSEDAQSKVACQLLHIITLMVRSLVPHSSLCSHVSSSSASARSS
jgi:hypothetical protein